MLNTVIQDMRMEIVNDAKRWDFLVDKFEVHDVYYTYQYCNSAALLEDGVAKLIYFKNILGEVLYPVIIRKIETDSELDFYDITTPYGYGGPLISGEVTVLEEFKQVFESYCHAHGIISEVIRLHPLLDNASYLSTYCELKYIRKTTAVNLDEGIEKVRQNYTKMNKRNIHKAKKSQLVCKKVEKTYENIEKFETLYQATMNRRHATEYYFFDSHFLRKQLADTSISKSHLLFAYHEDTVIAAVILYTSGKLAHYHLGASDKEYLHLRPNNLLFDFMIELTWQHNCEILHLGGGYQEDDNLFKYKTSFTNNNNYDYFIGMNIFDEESYQQVVERKRHDYELTEGFFPQYRGLGIRLSDQISS